MVPVSAIWFHASMFRAFEHQIVHFCSTLAYRRCECACLRFHEDDDEEEEENGGGEEEEGVELVVDEEAGEVRKTENEAKFIAFLYILCRKKFIRKLN